MLGKINCVNIIKGHTSTLRRQDTDTIRASDIFVFYILPALISLATFVFSIAISVAVVPLLITSLSIFAALLFNLLLLVYGAISRNGIANIPERIKYLKEIFNNISFSILIAVFTVVVLLVYTQFVTGTILKVVFSFFIYYFAIVFLFALFMVLKRIHILLGKEADYYLK